MEKSREQTFIDTLESLNLANECLKAENESLKEKVEGYALYAKIKMEKGKKLDGKSPYFTKLMVTPVKSLVKAKVLSNNAAAFLFSMLPFIYYKTNFLVDNGHNLNILQISKLIGWNRNTVASTIKRLEELGLVITLKQGNNTSIMMNPKYFFKGANNDTLVATFDGYAKKVLH